MGKRAFIAIFAAAALALAGARPVFCSLSTGNGYELESSVQDSGGGDILTGGEYYSRASVAQVTVPEGTGNSVSGEYVNRSGFYNPPHFTFQKGLVSMVDFNSGKSSLSLPAGAVDKLVFDITLNYSPVTQPLEVDPSIISQANSKMERNEGSWSRLFSGHVTEMSVFDEQDVWDKPFAEKGSLSMRYADDDGDGILDNSYPPVRVDSMNAWMLDTGLAMWAKLPGAELNTSARSITAPFSASGVYALLGTVDESVRDVYAFPVPFRPYGPKAGSGAGQTGTESDGITFVNVPQVGHIDIFTLDGRLARRLEIPAGLVISKVKWDVRTSAGSRAASGVYIWRVVSGGNSKTGKLMVIW